MVRLLAIVLSMQLLFAGVASAIDLHDSSGCSDATSVVPSDTGEQQTPGYDHPGNCCFGSLLFGSPSTVAPFPLLALADGPAERRNSFTVDWHSKAPDRPPRS